MNIIWNFNASDIQSVNDFVNRYKIPSVQGENVNRAELIITKDLILKNMLMCLLTTQEGVKYDKKISAIFNEQPFYLNAKFLSTQFDIRNTVFEFLKSEGLTPSNKIVDAFVHNHLYLLQSEWELKTDLEKCACADYTPLQERELADNIDMQFKGFGSIQARSFLQAIVLTKYEIAITPVTIEWLKNVGFPILFSPIALQDKSFYHFVSDGIQLLCEKANIYPCVLDAAIISSSCSVKP